MNRGEVWDYKPSYGPAVRVLVLSRDRHNAVAWPICAYLMRRRDAGCSEAVILADPDPVGGAVDLTTLGSLNPDRLSGPVGMLTGATMARVSEAVRVFLDV